MKRARQCNDGEPSARGFSLVEALVVIGIIALLLAILLPSLSRARSQARHLRIRAMLRAMDTGLELFHNDFGYYPPSDVVDDPIVDYPTLGRPPDNAAIWGAHRLARALIGPDGQGMDIGGLLAQRRRLGWTQELRITMAQVREMPRVGPYVEGLKAVPDTDPRWGEADRHPPSGRPLIVDPVYEFPILYYCAKPRAPAAFAIEDSDLAVYNSWDNGGLTGWDSDYSGPVSFWDFAKTGRKLGCHPLAEFGSLVPDRVNLPAPCAGFGKTFVGALHDEGALRAAGVVKPVNPERFVLIHPGPDAIWGTDDDITNFE